MPWSPPSHNAKKVQANREAADRQRGSSNDRGYDSTWRAYSKDRLLDHPYCVMCESQGVMTLATVTDHIKPAKAFPELFDEPTNHQSLCGRHNVIKECQDKKD